MDLLNDLTVQFSLIAATLLLAAVLFLRWIRRRSEAARRMVDPQLAQLLNSGNYEAAGLNWLPISSKRQKSSFLSPSGDSLRLDDHKPVLPPSPSCP